MKKEQPENLGAEKIIEKIIGRGIDWFDPEKLDQQSQRNYFDDAEIILSNETFNNELHHYITDLVKFIVYEAQDFDQVLHTRSAIVTLESFKDRFKKIIKPVDEQPAEDPNAAI